MKILDSTRPLSELVNDNSNGLGQIQPIECVVTEELNGIYECEFTVPITDKHYKDLKDNGLIKVTVGDGSEQIFRVYEVGQPINLVSTFKCAHITYDLNKVVVKPFTATGAVNIKNQLVANMLGSYPFSTWTDITNTTSTFTNDIPRYFRECLGGYEGSVLDVLRPEYEWDNLTVKLHARRGSDNGVRISYGKNLIDYSQEQNNENVYDGVYGYAVVDEVTYKADSYYNKTGATYPRILNVDFSSDYESGQVPTSAELLQKATTYAQNNSIEVPSINIKIDFIPLWQTEEYKNILPLERVSLGDTVHVYFDKLNVEASSRVIKTEWNVLTQKYDSIELGDAKANLNTIINDSVSTAVDEAVSDLDIDVGWLDTKAENMFKLIANGVGLHITKDSQGRIILHNDEDISQSKYQYMITAQGFMMSDDYGQEGSWRSGWTTSGDAVVNSLATIVLNALEINGSTINGTIINFGDLSDKYITAQSFDGDGDNVVDGVTFDGNGYVRFQPQEQFTVNNLTANEDLLNEFVMSSSGTNSQAFIALKNYDFNNNELANAIDMDAKIVESSNTFNRLRISNYETVTGTSTLSNDFIMNAKEGDSENNFELSNYIPGSNLKANRIYMRAYNYESSDIAWKENQLNIANFKTDSSYVANRITMSAKSYKLTLQNYNRNADTLGNQLTLTSTNTAEQIQITNYKYGSGSSLANEIRLNGYPLNDTSSANTIRLNNYDVDGNNIADYINMSKSRNLNRLEMVMNRGGREVASLSAVRDSAGLVTMSVKANSDSGYGYKYAGFMATSSGIASIDGEYQVSLGSNNYSGQEIYIGGHRISFSGGYVRYS